MSRRFKETTGAQPSSAAAWLRERRWALRSAQCNLVRAMASIWDGGGGTFSTESLADDYGIYVTDGQLRDCVNEFLHEQILLEVDGGYEFTSLGKWLAREIDGLLIREASLV